ncbi:DnaJ domain-containing protein [Clostridium botulinum]|uniref:DnaJ domain-containing protein n=1 Tax=Clostridium botulinum TaxID=1491 RepID=UPI0013FF3D3B|nr:DnaJ domain-containing protein [Clostridium botulinum]MBN1050437.1 hypothetical protein [Clostridium botulinum]NFI54732.1 hypothetical protein [Clostridium botulinum]
MHFLIIVIFLIWIYDKNNNGEKKEDFNCECPYCNRKYNLDDGSYSCECGNSFRKINFNVYKSEETIPIVVEVLVKLLAYISKADGKVTEDEIKIVKEIIDETEFNINQLKWCSNIFNEYKKLTYDKNILYTLNDYIQDNKEYKKYILTCLIHIANIDGGISYNQNLIIGDVVSELEISLVEYENIKENIINKYNYKKDDLNRYYKILNIKQGCGLIKLKEAYRNLIKIYHPDIQISKNLPEEIMNDITEKYKEIQEAYEIIIKYENN